MIRGSAFSAQAQELLETEVESAGIEIVSVLIRQYYYKAQYGKQIEEKKINDQLVFTRESEAKAATENAKKTEIEAQGKAAVGVELERGSAEVTKIKAAGQTYARKKRAEADLLVHLAEAKGTELLNAAYKGIGSENLVGLEMAEVLRGLEVIVVPTGGDGGMNPLDLDRTLETFGVK